MGDCAIFKLDLGKGGGVSRAVYQLDDLSNLVINARNSIGSRETVA